ncbi:hypothetical protein MBLNU13_g07541t1 [Cladosporium sp. NU13]
MSTPKLDLDRIKGMADAVVELVKKLKLSIETTSTRINATMLRDQTLANVAVILALYKDPDPKDYSAPMVIIASDKDQVCAATVRTYYNVYLKKSEMVTTIKGPEAASEYKALEGLYKKSRAEVHRTSVYSKKKNAEGFDFWDDLDW